MPAKSTLQELWEELRTVLQRSRVLDAMLPPILFLLANSLLGLTAAVLAALGLAAAISALRLLRKENWRYALGGLGSVLLAVLVVWIFGRAEGYFLPNLLSGGLTVGICLISILVGRPLTAWTSFITRRWPLAWYWQPKVRPAYLETTLLWLAFFTARLWWQALLFHNGETAALAWVNTLTGWPAIIILLVVTYLYGLWRLRSLAGPSVEEFIQDTPPPWQSQRRGF